jgi:peptide subunit release factor RF-3
LHCGYNEVEIDEMSYIFYKDLIAEIAIQLQYDSVVHFLGRDYSDESTMEFVNNQNPFFVQADNKDKDKNVKTQSSKKLTIGALQEAGMFKQK